MKNLLIFGFLIGLTLSSFGQGKTMSTIAIAQKGVTVKQLSSEKNLKIEPNDEVKIVSWRNGATETARENTEIMTPEYILQVNDEECVMSMKDMKKFDFKHPAGIKEFWEVYTIKNDVIEGIAKNGLRYDLRAEFDDESIEFLGLLGRNDLFFQDDYLEDYIQSLLYRIHQGKLDDQRTGTLNLLVVKESVPNAYSLPNGSIIVTTGLLSTIDSEDELIGVLAHEVSHFVGDHHINNLLALEKKERNAQFWAGVATVVAAAADAYAATNSDYYNYGALTYSTAVISSAIAASVVDRFGMRYNNEQEFAADEGAYEVMEYIGLKPSAYVSALNKISEYMYRTGNYQVFLNTHTHPSIDSRLAKLESSLESYYCNDYQIAVSLANTYNAKVEFEKKHFPECIRLVDKNIAANVATEEDYILKAMATRVLFGDKEHNLLALKYLEQAESLGLEPNSYIHKQKGITYMRLNQTTDARMSFDQYLSDLHSLLEQQRDPREQAHLQSEISWTKKMIYKASI